MRKLHSPERQSARESRVRQLLLDGISAAQVAKRTGLSREYVHYLARTQGWPTNPNCPRGGRLENQIVRAARFCTLTELAGVFHIAPKRVKAILLRVDAEARRYKTLAKQAA